MKRSAFLFTVATLGLTFAASAYDIDPGTYDNRRWYGGREYNDPYLNPSGKKPLYYRPTMRYYGNGYTVNYRYIPVYVYDSPESGAMSSATNFRTEAFHISTDGIPSWGANSPRLTVKDAHSAAPRTTITTIVRKTPSGKKSSKAAPTDASAPADAPAITPAPAVAPAPAAPAPAPDAAPVQPKP